MVLVGVVGAVLGLLAFGADAVGGMAGQVLVALTSSGFSWGLAAFLVGRFAAVRRQAIARAAVLLVVATLVYYALIVFVSRRWSGGYLEDGSPADMMGLLSVAKMTALWLFGSLVAGPVLGLLGHAVRSERTDAAALAAGVACGALSGEGWQSVAAVEPWRLLGLADAQEAEFVRGVVAGEVLRVALPVGVLLWLTLRHRLRGSWPVLLGAFVVSGGAGALCWYAIYRI
ncbi:hypothetical protein ACQP2P_13910 [Dactylosporangium sp. CA-139114]|uniref:hypothetical protein n=1 Tax=Dactylosporangium sp. CA-139114 TaxID=3239931 RepID=UPI003D964400